MTNRLTGELPFDGVLKHLSKKVEVELENEIQEWYFVPYWFRRVYAGVYEPVSFEQLPDNVKEIIYANRNNESNG